MFSLFTKKYQRLRNQSPDDEENGEQKDYRQKLRIYQFATCCNLVLLLASILINFLFLYTNNHPPTTSATRSEFARISYEIPREYFHPKPGQPLSDEIWDSIPKVNGIVALGDEYTGRFPPAQAWPWDNSKHIFFLQGHHSLHCLKQLRRSIFEYRHHNLQTQHWHHIDHCLEILRDDIICTADDTPRATSSNRSLNGFELGQTRLCRNWTKLDEWADRHTACFQNDDESIRHNNQLELYKHCPDGSRPWERLDK